VAKLDDLAAYSVLDRSNMYAHIIGLPEQITRSWAEARHVIIPAPYLKAEHIVMLGMGGSAIGGSFVKSLVTGTERIPVMVVRDYTVPHFVGRHSLVVAVSYSGATEETVSAFRRAAAKGAKLVAISSGGDIRAIAEKHRSPFYHVSYLSQPRAALGPLVVPLLSLFDKLGLLALTDADIQAVAERLRVLLAENAREIPGGRNRAKTLAQRMAGRLVVTAGSEHLAQVARRWKTQVNENAKQAAFREVFPELCHNLIAGLERPKTIGKEVFFLLFPSAFAHQRNQQRLRLFGSQLARRGIPYETVAVDDPPSQLSELFEMVLLGDLTSYYLAMLNDVDPTPVEAIRKFKEELGQFNER
jgi:glucose/mannose-6-phosphate isomerase